MSQANPVRAKSSQSLLDSTASILGAYLAELDLQGADLLHAKLAMIAAEALDDTATPAHAKPRYAASLSAGDP
jgi:hypothetical protein